MPELNAIEEIRLSNLKLLHGRATLQGGPTSELVATFFAENGVKISKSLLSDIYWRKRPIDTLLASKIEQAFNLPDGWLNIDQRFWLSASLIDLATIQAFLKLPASTKSHLAGIIDLLGEVDT